MNVLERVVRWRPEERADPGDDDRAARRGSGRCVGVLCAQGGGWGDAFTVGLDYEEGTDEMNLLLRYKLRTGEWRGIGGDAMAVLRKASIKDRSEQEAALFNVLLDGKHVVYPDRIEIVAD